MAFEFDIIHKEQSKKFDLWLGHQNMIALLKEHHTFNSFLDIGAGEGCATKIMKHLGKETISIEPGETKSKYSTDVIFEPDYKEDYFYLTVDKKFDVIWCSHVLEHILNPGIFLSKIFNDLNEDGILALTVPYHDMDDIESIVDGHIGRYSVAIIIYLLINCGFDCKDISINFHGYEMVVFLKKKSIPLKFLRHTAGSFVDLIPFFPELGQSKTFSGERLIAMSFKKEPINWKW